MYVPRGLVHLKRMSGVYAAFAYILFAMGDLACARQTRWLHIGSVFNLFNKQFTYAVSYKFGVYELAKFSALI